MFLEYFIVRKDLVQYFVVCAQHMKKIIHMAVAYTENDTREVSLKVNMVNKLGDYLPRWNNILVRRNENDIMEVLF